MIYQAIKHNIHTFTHPMSVHIHILFDVINNIKNNSDKIGNHTIFFARIQASVNALVNGLDFGMVRLARCALTKIIEIAIRKGIGRRQTSERERVYL